MLRDPRALLWDICPAADVVSDFTRGRTIEDYKADRFLRSAVERQLTIVGEAVAQLSRLTPDLAQRIPDQVRVIAFRNLLVHGYDVVVDEVVWAIVQVDLPALRARADQLQEEIDSGS
jgi:uncharacterized protein with HEPN domain